MSLVAYKNVRLIDPASSLDGQGILFTEGGLIADIKTDDAATNGAEVIDCDGRVLCPGLIDMRVFVGEPGAEHKETLASASEAAAAGGVTCIIMQPNTEPVIDDVPLVEYIKRQARDKAKVRIHPMAAITRGLSGEQMAELGLLSEADAVAFTDADRSVTNAQVLRRVLSYASTFDLLVCQYLEEPNLAGSGVMNQGEIAMRLGLPGIPPQAETIMVERDLRLVEMTGGRYHAACLSTSQAVEVIARGKANGLPVTAAVAVHNFALNEGAVGEYRSFAKTAPPLRSETDRQAVVQGLVDGSIDVICSCHDPQDAESKRLPFELAATGIIGLETILPLSLELYHNGAISLIDLLSKLTSRPAELLRLRGGKLAPGAPADLLIFDPDKPWRIDEEKFHSKSQNTPYHGRPVQGRVWRTIVDGQIVYSDPEGE